MIYNIELRMEASDLLWVGAIGLSAFFLGKFFDTRSAAAKTEQTIGKATANAVPIPQYSTISVQESTLDPNKLLLRNVQDGQLTTYKVNTAELSPYQRLSVESGYYTIKNDVLKPTLITFNPIEQMRRGFHTIFG